MALTPRLSLVPNPHDDQSASAALDEADVRLTVVDRQLVKDLLAELEQRLSVEALMFLAGGAEDAAWRKQAAKEDLRRS